MPSSVRAERNLCAQTAATATLRISKSFTWLYYGWTAVLVTNVGGKAATSHSYLNDSIGSSRAAFQAGHNPKTIPTAAEIPTPTPIAHAGTNAGRGEYLFIKMLANSPTISPTSPPIPVS